MNFITKFAYRLMLVAAFTLCVGVAPPNISSFLDVGGELCAEDGQNGGESAFFTNGSCSGEAAAWVGASTALAIALLAGAAVVWKKAKWAFKLTPTGIAISLALAVVAIILAALGIKAGYFSVMWSNQCYSVSYRDFF